MTHPNIPSCLTYTIEKAKLNKQKVLHGKLPERETLTLIAV
jgi:hypothetical protein